MSEVLEAANDWDLVRKALENPNWDFRTVEGIASDTSLPPERIEAALESHSSDVRKAYVKDSRGRLLFALATRKPTLREFAANTVAFISGTSTS